jgi:20S proteasome alpha/beta subunit
MTYILGSKCSDGVVLAADRKVTYPDGHIEYSKKLFQYYYPIVVGAAGSNPMINNFLDDALRAAQNRPANVSGIVYFNPLQTTDYEYYVINYGNYIKKIEQITLI